MNMGIDDSDRKEEFQIPAIRNEPGYVQIPTTDPQAALLFCQALAKSITINSKQRFITQSDSKTEFLQQRPAISVVIPVFDEEDNLPLLYQRLTDVLGDVEPLYELIFVDDGSLDSSVQILEELAENDPKLIVVQLARNFGHQIAISAGLDFARGDGVIIMDADLQDPPEVLPEFIEKWREGHDIVYAIRTNRKEGWLKRNAYSFFYRILQRIANIQIPLDAGDFCIMDRRAVLVLNSMPERNRFIRGIRSWIGLDQVGLAYDRDSRYAGQPKFTLSRLIYLALDGLVSFSFLPLRAISILGFIISIISLVLAVSYTIQKLTRGLNPPGFATTIVAIFFLAGIQLITLGVIGEYVGRIFEEVKRRPLYVVKKISKSP
jgi:glycosyltransferase involved in cell wall biosynthesis